MWDLISDFVGWVGDNTETIGAVAKAGATVASAVIASDANKAAAETAAQGAQAQANAIKAGNDAAQKRYEDQLMLTEPGTNYLRTLTLSDPTRLTPEQQAEIENATRTGIRTLNASGLRGSGRTSTALIKNIAQDVANRAYTANRSRADQAAQILAGQTPGYTAGAAGTDINAGTAQGNAFRDISLTNAGSDLANAKLSGQALADVGSIIADATKKRESRFAEDDGTAKRKKETL